MGVDKQGEREAFESLTRGKLSSDVYDRDCLGFYNDESVWNAYEGWKARASHDAALREELVAAYVILLKNIKAYYPANYCTFEQAFKNEIAILEKIKGA